MVKVYYLLAFLAFIYLLVCLFLYLRQEKFIFYPETLASDFSFPYFNNFEEQYYEQKNGARIHALYFKVDQPRGVVLYFHGNAGALDTWGFEAEEFTRRGYDVLMPDYRGYGKSTGRLTERALHKDAKLLYKALRAAQPEQKIVLYGRSLGSGIACALAARVDADFLILETPYSSLLDMSAHSIPYVPVHLLLKYRLNSKRNLPKVKCPVHLFHGTEDELIPYAQAQMLAKVYGKADVLTTIPGGGHNNLGDFPLFQQKLDQLLDL